MELSSINSSLALQGSVQQAKAKNSEAVVNNPFTTAKTMESFKDQQAEKQQQVQESSGSNAQSVAVKAEQGSLDEIRQIVQEKLRHSRMSIQVEVDKDTEQMLVLVKDPVTDELIRKIPPDELLKPMEIAREFKQQAVVAGEEVDVKY